VLLLTSDDPAALDHAAARWVHGPVERAVRAA
jgi:hypothetical protein